jgi:hypothetical protein
MLEESRSFRVVRKGAATAQGAGESRPALARRGEAALKAIAWSDLTARLEAARDLRLALRLDAQRSIADATASFSDAAAKYFRTLEGNQPLLNLGALDDHKGSAPILSGTKSSSANDRNAGMLFARDDAKDEQ